MKSTRLKLCSVLIVFTAIHCAECNRAMSDLVEELLSSPRYNSRTRPSSDRGVPLNVFININVNDISSISEVSMEYSMTLYLRQMWQDERLAFTSYNRSITLNHNQFDRLWTPDVFIRNLKAGVFHSITVPNRLIRLSPDGTILYSQRLTLTLACDMMLDRYPMDNQTCAIEFGSYAYATDDLVLNWRTDADPVEMSQSISLPEYVIKGVTHNVCTKMFNSTGNFPCLSASFHLHRRLRAYILTTYLPSFLVVLLSWLSFWIDLESAPARTSLSILTILTITTQSSGLMRSMPAGSFTRAIDVWMATCLVFVFGAFIEYSIVNTLARRQKARSLKGGQPSWPKTPQKAEGASSFRCCACLMETAATANGWPEDDATPSSGSQQVQRKNRSVQDPCHSESEKPSTAAASAAETTASALVTSFRVFVESKEKAVVVEIVSRILFPFMFLVFNLVYWPMYLS